MNSVTPFPHTRIAGIDADLAAQCGAPAESPAPAKTGKPTATFQPLTDLLKAPPAEDWTVKGFIPANSIIVPFGNSGDGKTFVTIDLICHIACGLPWLGHKTRQGPVMYLAGEGQNGIIRRFKAWFEAHPGHDDAAANILIRTIPAALCDPVATADLLAEIVAMPVKPQAIAIDTLARNYGPGDENSTRDMSAFVAALDALRTVSGGAAILLPHHSGHGDKSRARGSSVLKGAIDAEFCIERKDTRITMSCSKMKDADEPAPVAWILTRQNLPWCDEDGVPLNSAVLVPTQAVVSTRSTKLTLPQRIALDVLTCLTGTEDHALIADWRNAAFEAGISQSESKQGRYAAFNRAVNTLVDSGKVRIDGPRCYLADRATESTKSNVDCDVDSHVDRVDCDESRRSTESTESTKSNVDCDVDSHVDRVDCDESHRSTESTESTKPDVDCDVDSSPPLVDRPPTEASTESTWSTQSTNGENLPIEPTEIESTQSTKSTNGQHVDFVDSVTAMHGSQQSQHTSLEVLTMLTVQSNPNPNSLKLVCRWNDLNRLVTKCGNPNPTADGSGCATCGEVKTKPGGRKEELSGAQS
jgi:hypothetical protein